MDWQSVLKIKPDASPYMTTAGYDRNATYEYRRGFDGVPWIGCAATDFHPQFNVAGLWWRPLPPPDRRALMDKIFEQNKNAFKAMALTPPTE